MTHYDYLIIGGGMTAASAAGGIRKIDTEGTIGMFSLEADPPYSRPPLTKGLWKGKSIDSIWRKLKEVDLHLGRGVTRIQPAEKQVICGDGSTYSYGKLLLATGGTPRQLPFKNDRILYYRTAEDYRRLRDLADNHRHFAVIGSGFIGSEIAAALTMNDKEVTMIFPGKTIGEHVFPADLSQFISQYYEKKGVKLLAEDRVVASEARGEQVVLQTEKGSEVVVDGVVAGLGIEPNVALAESAGLKTENGIVVDKFLRTSEPDIYAAGDVASFPSLGTHRRVEHENNANTMGKQAGHNMAGPPEPYDYLPYFYSDLFDLGYEAVGELDSRMETVADWKEPHKKGVVYYLREGRVRGVLLWNVWKKLDAARELIAEPGPFDAASLNGRLT